MFALATIDLAAPVTITFRGGRRSGSRTFSRLELCFDFVPAFRLVFAQIAGIPRPLPIYGPEDWPFILADSPEHHAARVVEILGADPAPTLQALCDGTAIPQQPPRVPRELPNWRLKAVLSSRGLLDSANAAFDALPAAQRDIAKLAWHGDAKCARRSQSVLFIAGALGLDSDAIDKLFREAERLEI